MAEQVRVAVVGGPSPFGFSGIWCFTRLHDEVSIFKPFFFAPMPTWDTVVVTPFFVTVFAPVVTTSSPGCGLPFAAAG